MTNCFFNMLGKGTKMLRMFLIFSFSQCLISLTSCSEADDTVEEFADWQSKNETYFEQKYQEYIAAQTATKFVLRSWTQSELSPLSDIEHTKCILVDVISSGTETTSPFYDDQVAVHYTGRLIPSPNYPKGYSFDYSYMGDFDPAVSHPTELSVDGVVEGLSTALQRMHRGDYWRVTIPYQLGYGSSGRSAIPGYSTLIFDVRLVDFWNDDDDD